jgi:hypothetical protein
MARGYSANNSYAVPFRCCAKDKAHLRPEQ